MPVTRKDLMCEVANLAYDFDSRKGTLNLAPGHCCDMEGCINLFTKIDPDVQFIETYSGEEPDTVYRRKGNDWESNA